jgi:hypothetical protein
MAFSRQAGIVALYLVGLGVGGGSQFTSGLAATNTLNVPSGTESFRPAATCAPGPMPLKTAFPSAPNGVSWPKSGDLLLTIETPLGCAPNAISRGTLSIKVGSARGCTEVILSGDPTGHSAKVSPKNMSIANDKPSEVSSRYQISTRSGLGFPSNALTNASRSRRRAAACRRNNSTFSSASFVRAFADCVSDCNLAISSSRASSSILRGDLTKCVAANSTASATITNRNAQCSTVSQRSVHHLALARAGFSNSFSSDKIELLTGLAALAFLVHRRNRRK